MNLIMEKIGCTEVIAAKVILFKKQKVVML